MQRVSLVLFFVSFCFTSSSAFVCHLEGVSYNSPSLCRCISAILYGFTDDPPFDGKSVQLHFNSDYNETELEETVRILGPERILESETECMRKIERNYERNQKRHARLYTGRRQLWKEQVLAENVQQKCNDYLRNLNRTNSKKSFWQKKEDPVKSICPVFRSVDLHPDLEWSYKLEHPCIETACLEHDLPVDVAYWNLNTFEYFNVNPKKIRQFSSCINKIKLKI